MSVNSSLVLVDFFYESQRLNKDVLNEFHWLFELQSRNSHKCGNEGFESLSEVKCIGREIEKNEYEMNNPVWNLMKSSTTAPKMIYRLQDLGMQQPTR